MNDKDKDPRKLTTEELEKRVAPFALTYSDPTTDPPPPPPSTDPILPDPPTGGGPGRGGKVVK